MKHSPKNEQPSELSDWVALASDDWAPSWENFQNPQKRAVHKSLLQEQGFVCAYCGRGLKADHSDSHIEHFWPRTHYRARELDYGNFYASCGPEGEPGVAKTCGDAKADWHDPTNHDLFPSHPDCERRFRYDSTGQIKEKRKDDALASRAIIALNLDEDALKHERSVLIAGLERDIVDGEINSTTRDEEIALWRALDKEGRAKSLGHVAALYLEQELT